MNYRVIQTGHNSHLLISYDTVVAGVNKNLEITLYSGWDYGRTTVGHVMRFINGYTPTRKVSCLLLRTEKLSIRGDLNVLGRYKVL